MNRRGATIDLTGRERYGVSVSLLMEVVEYLGNGQYEDAEVISHTIAHLWHDEPQAQDKLWTNAAKSLGTAMILIGAEIYQKQTTRTLLEVVLHMREALVAHQDNRVEKALHELPTDHPAWDYWTASIGFESNPNVSQAIIWTGWAGLRQVMAYQDEMDE